MSIEELESTTPATAAGPSAVEEVEKEYNPAGNDPDEVAWVPAELALRHAEALDRLRAENERLKKVFDSAVEVLGAHEALAYVRSENCVPVSRCTVPAGFIRMLVEEREKVEAALRGGVVVPVRLAEHLEAMSLEVGGKCHICDEFRGLLAVARYSAQRQSEIPNDLALHRGQTPLWMDE